MSAIEEHKEKRRALGRGLDSLLPSGPRLATVPSPAVMPPVVTGTAVPVPAPVASAPQGDAVQQIALDLIDENPYQTRRSFDEAALQELAASIQESGLAQPVVLRPGIDGRYILVLGERRCRASKLAGKTSVPAIVRELGNERAAELTVIENLQREDLNCLEQAQAFARLSREFNLTQEQIGKRVGTSRESVANYMRLLKLPQPVLDLIGAGKLGFSEARVLLEAAVYLDAAGLEKMAHDAVAKQWTVKELNVHVARLKNPETHAGQAEEKRVDPNVADAERRLREALGLRVQIQVRPNNKGRVLIRYESVEDFDRILAMLGQQ
jgi:ParB family chromosome partitioning protein